MMPRILAGDLSGYWEHYKLSGGWNWFVLCPVVSFGIRGAEPSSSATTEVSME
jgi:hypothetical protein